MAKVFDLTCWPVTIVPESELSHTTTVHHGFVPKLSHHGGKTPLSLKNHSSLVYLKVRLHELFFSDAIAKRCFFL